MQNNYKPGGGNKPQPYIPAGNGENSGEYTGKQQTTSTSIRQKKGIKNCFIKNIRFKYNFYKSKLVGNVNQTYIANKGVSIPKTGTPNSVSKKVIAGYVVTERYYNSNGEAYLDIDYTCHGSPDSHPYVPHIHRWTRNEQGELYRNGWEKFQ